MADAAYGSLSFKEQAEFFRRKLNLPTTSWTDIYTQEDDDWAFVVAGANRDAIIVSDFGLPIKPSRAAPRWKTSAADFDRIVAKHGWDHNGVDTRRSKVIYETNLNTSFAAGRWEQLQHAPYWQYEEHSDRVEHPRAQACSLVRAQSRARQPWWKLYFPAQRLKPLVQSQGPVAMRPAAPGKQGPRSDTLKSAGPNT